MEGFYVKKKYRILVSILAAFIAMSGCSSEKKSSKPIPFQNEDENRQTNKAVLEFEKKFFVTIDESNDLLQTFNKSLDGLYTGQTSNDQFVTVLTNIINKSNELVTTVEQYEVDPSLMEFKQQLVMHLNIQHQLFLDAVEMANEDNVNKGSLRETYLDIKQEQTNLVTAWKGY